MKNLLNIKRTKTDRNNLFTLDEIIDWTFPGITFYYRDCDLDPESIKLYNVGQIIRSDTFVDATHIIGKFLKNVRFTIFSAKTANFHKLNSNSSHYPLNTINANSYFKIIDILKLNDKHQICLLHIPMNGIGVFKNKHNTFKFPQYEDHIENVLIHKAREKFINSENSDVILELEESEWLKRTNWPVGLNVQNKLNPLEPISILNEQQYAISNLIRKITDDNFLNEELISFSFSLESKKQEILFQKNTTIINDNVLISLFPKPEKENMFIFIASELITSNGRRKVTIAEKELVITEIECNKLTFNRIGDIKNGNDFSINVILKAGQINLIIINSLVNNIDKQTQFIFE